MQMYCGASQVIFFLLECPQRLKKERGQRSKLASDGGAASRAANDNGAIQFLAEHAPSALQSRPPLQKGAHRPPRTLGGVRISNPQRKLLAKLEYDYW
jgi:hypothetical protein